MDDIEPPQRRCGYCNSSSPGNGNLMKCSGCLMSYYCNREHQVADWKRHKVLCKELQRKRSRENANSTTTTITTSISTTNDPPITIFQRCQLEMTIGEVSRSTTTIRQTEGASTSKSLTKIKEECVDEDDDGGGIVEAIIPKRASVIQMASSSAAAASKVTAKSPPAPPPPPPAENTTSNNKKRSQSNKSGPPARRARKSATARAGKGGSTTEDEYGAKKDHSLNFPLDLERDIRFRTTVAGTSATMPRQDVTSSRLAKVAQFAASSLREYGWAAVDKFIGERHCRAVLREMQGLHDGGLFTEARLMISKSGTQLHGVRSDTTLFLSNGTDGGIHIGLLVAMVDSLLFQMAGSIPPYNICGRTRPMLTCYPGQRSRYITHVDNPDNDGRCVTATYYLNEDWRPAHGGLLRMYPSSAFKPVDVEPIFDRLLLYWSDRRNPHEVLPSYRKRFSINLWYYDRDEKAANESQQMHCSGGANLLTMPSTSAGAGSLM